MRKDTKNKKNKVPKIGEKEYAEYIDFLKSEGNVRQVEISSLSGQNTSAQKREV
ncbi:MAG: hypothetical protein IJW58_04310 [Clostridia bacterium]|nr:hypothetical protein [Clostridia bacterium]